jgi:hypothetical protein
MDEIGVFTYEQARLLWQDFQRRQQLQPQLQANYPQRRPIDEVSPHRIFVHNTTDETIPAFGCMEIFGVETLGGLTTLRVRKPTRTDGEYIFNGPYPLAADVTDEETEITTYGIGWGYRHGTVLMLGDAPSVVGERYLPIVDSWEIEAGEGSFVVWGRDVTNERTLTGRIQAAGGGGVLAIRFKLIEPIFCETRTATGIVVSRPPGMSVVPEEDPYGNVLVYDLSGCFLTGSNLDLIGKIGYALCLYFDPIYDFEGELPDVATGTPGSRWHIISLCCSNESQCA